MCIKERRGLNTDPYVDIFQLTAVRGRFVVKSMHLYIHIYIAVDAYCGQNYRFMTNYGHRGIIQTFSRLLKEKSRTPLVW